MEQMDSAAYHRKNDATVPVDWVLTPGGYRHTSLVHHLPQGHKLRRRKQELQIVHRRSQRIVARYSIHPKDLPNIIPGLGSGWVTYAIWRNPTGSTISQIATTWTVPPAPVPGATGQIIYLFNGLQNPDRTNLLQPALQWGVTQAGGGSYWSISNWYIDDSGHATHSDFLQVPSQQILTGAVSLGQLQSDGLCSYTVGFREYSNFNLSASGVSPSPVAVQTMESYHIGDCNEYPATPSISMSSIFIAADGTAPPLDWDHVDQPDGCQEHTIINDNANPGGSVEIYYRN